VATGPRPPADFDASSIIYMVSEKQQKLNTFRQQSFDFVLLIGGSR